MLGITEAEARIRAVMALSDDEVRAAMLSLATGPHRKYRQAADHAFRLLELEGSRERTGWILEYARSLPPG